MASGLPHKERDYIGPVSNTRAWDGFALRVGDVIVSTPPKAGTTWMQTIVLMLLKGASQLESSVWYLSPWIDCAFRPRSRELLDAQTDRRCIKSHSPLDGIAYSPDATYLAIYRHPVDIHFSLQRHVENMKDDWLAFMYEGDIASNFARFLTYPSTVSGTDDTTLASIVAHYLSFRRWAHLPNVHLFHFAEMQRDLAGQIERLNEILSTRHAQEILDDIAEAASFEAMKSNASRHRRPDKDSPFKDETRFFATGRSGKWEGRLGEGDMSRFESTLATLLDSPDARWLAGGGSR